MLSLSSLDDPVLMIDDDDAPARINSVIKLVLDMFDSECCCQLFYTNDVNVLIDIVLRQISNLGSTEKVFIHQNHFHCFLKLHNGL